MICPYCNANIADNAKFCTQCGAVVERSSFDYHTAPRGETVYSSDGPQPYQFGYDNYNSYNSDPVDTSYSGMAIAGFVLSFFMPVLGLIFSAIGLKQCKKGRGGKGLATAGLVLSIIGLAFYFIITCTAACSGIMDSY